MWGQVVGPVCPARVLQVEVAVALACLLESEVEVPRVVLSLQGPRAGLVVPPGSPSLPVCPSPYATTPEPTPMAPANYQVWSVCV